MTSHRLIPLFSICALLSACTVTSTPFQYDVAASDVAGVSADVERGDITVRGAQTEQVSIAGESWGRARDEDKAAERQAGNVWAVVMPESASAPLHITATSDRGQAGVDFDIVAPAGLPAEIEVENGRVCLTDLRGQYDIEASGVELDAVGGELEIQVGTGGVYGILDLEEGDDILIVTQGGDVDLQLPYGLDYDLSVWSHPDALMNIDVAGLWVEQRHDGYYAGRGLLGDVHITIISDTGDVTVRNTYSWLD